MNRADVQHMRQALYDAMTDAAQRELLAAHAARHVEAPDTRFKAQLAQMRLRIAAERYETFVSLQRAEELARQRAVYLGVTAGVLAIAVVSLL